MDLILGGILGSPLARSCPQNPGGDGGTAIVALYILAFHKGRCEVFKLKSFRKRTQRSSWGVNMCRVMVPSPSSPFTS